MGVLSSIIQPSVLSVFHALENLFFGCCVAFQLISDDDARSEALLVEEFAEEFLGCFSILSTLYKDVQGITIRVYSTPQVVLLVIDGEEHLVQMPFVTRLRTATADLVGILLSKLSAPLPN